jgi:hypothetical protein
MRVILEPTAVLVRLSRWQKVVGLMRDITVAREHVGAVSVVENGVREAMGTGLKVGLRLPWLCYVGRTIRLDRAFVVRRGVPTLSIDVRDGGPLTNVLVSTPDAHELARALSTPAGEDADGDGSGSQLA